MAVFAEMTDVPGRRGCHVCWVVDPGVAYVEVAQALLSEGAARNQKLFVFGPEHSPALTALASSAAVAVDPGRALIAGDRLVPETMYATFREQASIATAEGYAGVRVVADMDWLLRLEATTAAIAGFEIGLDRVLSEIDATVVCAYRPESFDTQAILGQLALHPHAEASITPQFRLLAGTDAAWAVSGEVDLAVLATFAAGLGAITGGGDPCVLDVAQLEFIDVGGLRAIAEAGSATRVVLRGASPSLRHVWQLAGFSRDALRVELVA